MVQPDVRRFAEIKDALPADCWAVKRNARKAEFDDELVAVFDGPLALDALDLDDPLHNDAAIFLVFVRGDLTVAGTIGNANTDGAAGLIVAGNLTCRNAVVGGQQLYVTGDLTVEELFWGDYNHGDLIVGGDATAAMAIVTDGYDFTIRGERRFARWILDETEGGDAWRLDDPDALAEFIAPDLLFADDEDAGSLWREKILDAVRAGRTVICPDTPDGDGQKARALFPDSSITERNIRLVGAPHLLNEGGEDGAIGSVEFWSGDIFCRISRLPDGHREPETKIYLQLDERLAVLIGLFNKAPTLGQRLAGFIRRLTGKAPLQYPAMIWTDLESEDGWQELGTRSPPDVRELMARGWDVALDFVAARERLRAAIPVKALNTLLALPLVEPYDDFYDDDRNGLWLGRTYCAFRQQDARPGKPALLRVTVDEDDTNLFFYETAQMADGSQMVDVRFAAELRDDEYDHPGLTGGPELERAIRLFTTAQRNLMLSNAALMAGERVGDDGFALKHWRQKGYLKSRLG
ncbi:hypothetical protein ACLBXM_08540 [Xanthobacteraceae bacterium A53D]